MSGSPLPTIANAPAPEPDRVETQPAVQVAGVGKTYRVYARPLDCLREVVTRRPCHRAHRALADVTFDVPRGQGFGIIGENGAGKSTLLKILAGITAATTGRATVHGAAASILELGFGFHPELTGRQNIVLSAALLGLSERDVRRCTPEIIAFSELGEAIDEPLRGYSTGMAMRLAFAVAVQVQPDVLIVDEALSVGDGYFQRKCMLRIQQFLRAGGTLLLSSHAMYYVSEFCARALWLRDGRIAAIGPAESVIHDYETFLTAKARATLPGEDLETIGDRREPFDRPVDGDGDARAVGGSAADRGPARLTAVRQGGSASHAGGAYQHGDPWWLEVDCDTDAPGIGLHLAVGIDRVDGVQVFACGTRQDERPPLSGRTHYRLRLAVPSLPLIKGQFTAYVFLMDDAGCHVYDRRVLPGILEVIAPVYRAGIVSVAHQWEETP